MLKLAGWPWALTPLRTTTPAAGAGEEGQGTAALSLSGVQRVLGRRDVPWP